MNQVAYLNNQFIIAMPSLADPIFFHTVTYLCQHNKDGALGIVINRPSEMKLGEIFKQMNIGVTSLCAAEINVFSGGPVQQEHGFVLHTTEMVWDATMNVSDTVSLTTSRDVIEAIAVGEGPKKYLVALGYAGWGQGQLEQEILANNWLNSPYSQNVLFDTEINQRWQRAAEEIGIDINQLITQAGHA
ncbi:MAG: YqgE/AlgH family protein [Methylococcales bacterium]|jgi:putative transcriptional regulator|nr:YqgE/AlgH family protein [Methylococcales bacterium]